MNQMSNIKEVVKCFDMEECKPNVTPYDVNSTLLELRMRKLRMYKEKWKVFHSRPG